MMHATQLPCACSCQGCGRQQQAQLLQACPLHEAAHYRAKRGATSGGVQRWLASCPDNAFQKVPRGADPFSASQRLGAVLRNGAKLFGVRNLLAPRSDLCLAVACTPGCGLSWLAIVQLGSIRRSHAEAKDKHNHASSRPDC